MKSLTKNKLKEAAILSMALITAGNSAISGILVFMQKEFALTREASEFVITLSSIATIISIALSESITRLIGMKKCVQLGTILVFISGIIPIIHTSYQTILLSRIILGLGMGLFNGHSANYISALFTGEKAVFLHGMRSSMEYIGQMALLLIAGFLIKIKWPLAFLCYTFSIFVFLFFTKYVEDIRPEERKGRFFINKQVIFYIFFAGVMIMNITSLSIRFPTIATLQKGMDANINAYMIIIPLSGMAAGFAFGYINRALGEKTILFALLNYILANMVVAFWGSNMYVFMAAMLISAASGSIAFPYIFAEAMRFARGSQNRIINNLIFIGCNIGGFISPAFLFIVNKIMGTESLTQAFLGFSLIYLFLFLVYFYEYIKVNKRGII